MMLFGTKVQIYHHIFFKIFAATATSNVVIWDEFNEQHQH